MGGGGGGRMRVVQVSSSGGGGFDNWADPQVNADQQHISMAISWIIF